MENIMHIEWKSFLTILIGFSLTAMSGFVLANTSVYTIEVTERHLYGPGPFPDQKLKTAWIRNLRLDSFLTGVVKGVNNLGEEPNVSGEILQGKIVDGMLSDKTLINEDIDMANAEIMNGQFNLLLAAVYGGSNKGDTFFYLDKHFNWWIRDDIAIDPGFPAGVVKIDNFTFTTGPRVIPHSVQTELGYPGGTNQTGTLEAGRVAMGRLGDSNSDGYLDGVFNAIGRFPMEAIFLPGAPFVQTFEFKSDIPITPLEAALLNAASAQSYVRVREEITRANGKHRDIGLVNKKIKAGLVQVEMHLGRLEKKSTCPSTACTSTKKMLADLLKDSSEELLDRDFVAGVFDKMVAVYEQ